MSISFEDAKEICKHRYFWAEHGKTHRQCLATKTHPECNKDNCPYVIKTEKKVSMSFWSYLIKRHW